MAFGEFANFFGDWTETAQKAQKTAYDYNQTRGLGAALRDSMNPDGTPNERKYYELINKYKIDQDPAAEYFKRMAGIYSSGASTATSATQMEGLGADPSKLIGDPNASAGEMFGVKKKAVEPVGTTDVSSTSVPEPSKPSELDSRVATESGYTTTEPTPGQPTLIRPDIKSPVMLPPSEAPTAPQAPATSSMDLGSARLTGSVPPPAQPQAQPQGEPFVTDFLRNIKSPAGTGISGTGAGAGAEGTDASLFDWAPQNVDGNVYQQYSDALDKQLKAGGYSSPSDYLRKTYNAVLAENTPTSPNELQLVLGKEGIAKYGDQRQAYIAAMGIARGKAEKAVIEARGKLDEFAQRSGTAAVDQRKTELPAGMVLRDPAKRNEAASLLTNAKTIKFAAESVAKAGTDGAALEMAAPQAIRAYATALNPGQQLSEGNLRETAMTLYPEFGNNHDMTMKIAGAMLLAFKGDSSALRGIMSKVDNLSPVKLATRLRNLVHEAAILNQNTLTSYVVSAPELKEEAMPAPVVAQTKEEVAAKAILGPAKTSKKDAKPTGPAVGATKVIPGKGTFVYVGKGQWRKQ